MAIAMVAGEKKEGDKHLLVPLFFCRQGERYRKRSTKTACNVILGEFVARIGENLLGRSDFNEIAQMKIGGTLGNP